MAPVLPPLSCLFFIHLFSQLDWFGPVEQPFWRDGNPLRPIVFPFGGMNGVGGHGEVFLQTPPLFSRPVDPEYSVAGAHDYFLIYMFPECPRTYEAPHHVCITWILYFFSGGLRAGKVPATFEIQSIYST